MTTAQAGKAISPEGWIRRWAAIVIVLLIALGGTTLAYLHASTAADRAHKASVEAGGVSACVNNILATRNKPSTDDNAAVLAYLRADANYNRKLNAVFAAPKSEQMALFEKFKAASLQKDRVVSQAIATITHDKQLRAAHPLGKC